MPLETKEQVEELAAELEVQIANMMAKAGIRPSGPLSLALLSLGTLQAARGGVCREEMLQMAGSLYDFHVTHNLKWRVGDA